MNKEVFRKGLQEGKRFHEYDFVLSLGKNPGNIKKWQFYVLDLLKNLRYFCIFIIAVRKHVSCGP